jgi:hypothetical protein
MVAFLHVQWVLATKASAEIFIGWASNHDGWWIWTKDPGICNVLVTLRWGKTGLGLEQLGAIAIAAIDRLYCTFFGVHQV